MGVLLMIHSIVRWIIVVVAIAAIVKFALGWLQAGRFAGMDRGLSSGFSGLLDLQVLLGILYLLWSGLAGAGFPAFRVEHAVTMFVAAVVGHVPMRWKDAADTPRFRNSLLAIAASLVIIFVGVTLFPSGWTR